MMTFENISSIQIIGTKWKFHACPASRYALRVAVGKNPRKLSLSGLHSRRPWLSWAGIIALMKSAIITREPLSRVLNQDFRAEWAFCPLGGNLFALLSANCFLHHLDSAWGFQLLSLFGKPWQRSERWQSSFVSCRAHWRWHQDISWSWLTWVVSSLLLIVIIQDRDQFHVDIHFLCSLISGSVIIVSFLHFKWNKPATY